MWWRSISVAVRQPDGSARIARMSFPVITDLIGNTPIVRLQRMQEPGMAELLLKLEMFNPGYSVKDRIGERMIDACLLYTSPSPRDS